MRMQSGTEDIFGDTSEGVPNPLVPHVHPYPTRYHGPMWVQPQAMKPFLPTPYARAPYAGLGAAPGNMSLLLGVQVLSAAASGYHGYKRHYGSVGWGLLWAALGLAFPIVTPAVAVSQGYGMRGSRRGTKLWTRGRYSGPYAR
jgi:hypothetical protein